MIKKIIFVLTIVLTITVIGGKAQTEGSKELNLVNKDEEVSETEIFEKYEEIVKMHYRGSEGESLALLEIKKLLAKHPNSIYAPVLQFFLTDLYEREADRDFRIAMFYLKRRNFKLGAESRLKHILENYPNYSHFDEALYQLGLLFYEDKRKDDAVKILEKLVNRFSYSTCTPDAYILLDSLSTFK